MNYGSLSSFQNDVAPPKDALGSLAWVLPVVEL